MKELEIDSDDNFFLIRNEIIKIFIKGKKMFNNIIDIYIFNFYYLFFFVKIKEYSKVFLC